MQALCEGGPPSTLDLLRRGKDLLNVSSSLQHCVVVANGQASGQQTKYQKGLRTSLVLDIILDWVGDEVLDLEEHLHKEAAHIS